MTNDRAPLMKRPRLLSPISLVGGWGIIYGPLIVRLAKEALELYGNTVHGRQTLIARRLFERGNGGDAEYVDGLLRPGAGGHSWRNDDHGGRHVQRRAGGG